MMDTVLNIGLSDAAVAGLAKLSGNERFAYDSYRRLINMFGDTVMGVDHEHFEHELTAVKTEKGAKLDTDLYVDVFGPKVTIEVTHGGDTIPQEDFPFLAQAALDGRIDLARFVTSTISLDDVPERLSHIGEGGEIRTVALLG